MKKIGIVTVGAVTLCWAMYEVSSDNTNTVTHNEASQKVTFKNFSSTAKNEKLAPQILLAQTNSLNSAQFANTILTRLKKIMIYLIPNILIDHLQ